MKVVLDSCFRMGGALSIALTIFALSCSTPPGVERRLNDERAYDALKQLRSAEQKFRSGSGHGRWGSLADLHGAGLVDQELGTGVKWGYQFEVRIEGPSYQVSVKPLRTEDDRSLAYIGTSFYLDETGIIRGVAYGRLNNYTPAGKNDQILINQE